MRERVKGLAAVALGLLLGLLLAEVGLRIYQRVARGVPLLTVFPGYRETRFPLSPFLVFGPRVDWQIPGKRHPEHAYFNAQGFRTRDVLGPKPPGEVRLIALGGSTTEDVWNDAGYHWPLALEWELHAAGRRDVRVYNGAMSAWTTAHSLVRLAFDIPQYEPDIVLVMHNVNDLTVNYQAARRGKSVDPNYWVKYGLKSYTGVLNDSDVVLSRVLHSVRSRLAGTLERDEPPIPEVDVSTGRAIFARNLATLDAVASLHGMRLVLLTMPVSRSPELFEFTAGIGRRGRMDPLPEHSRFLADFESYNEAIRETGRARGIPVIDMEARLAPDDRYFDDIVHLTTEGVLAFAKAAAPEVERLLPPPAPPSE